MFSPCLVFADWIRIVYLSKSRLFDLAVNSGKGKQHVQSLGCRGPWPLPYIRHLPKPSPFSLQSTFKLPESPYYFLWILWPVMYIKGTASVSEDILRILLMFHIFYLFGRIVQNVPYISCVFFYLLFVLSLSWVSTNSKKWEKIYTKILWIQSLIRSAWEWYHWIGLEKDINHCRFYMNLISLLVWITVRICSNRNLFGQTMLQKCGRDINCSLDYSSWVKNSNILQSKPKKSST